MLNTTSLHITQSSQPAILYPEPAFLGFTKLLFYALLSLSSAPLLPNPLNFTEQWEDFICWGSQQILSTGTKSSLKIFVLVYVSLATLKKQFSQRIKDLELELYSSWSHNQGAECAHILFHIANMESPNEVINAQLCNTPCSKIGNDKFPTVSK